MNINTTNTVSSGTPVENTTTAVETASDGGDAVNFWANLFNAFGDFGSWIEDIFGMINAGDVSALQLLKAMKEQQKLLVFVMAMSLASVMFTVYMQEQ